MAYNQIFHTPHSWKDIWNEARKHWGQRQGVLSITTDHVNDMEIQCCLIPRPKTVLYSCQIRVCFPQESRPVVRLSKTVGLADDRLVHEMVDEAIKQWKRERREMEGLGWRLVKDPKIRQHYVTWERKLTDDYRVYIGRDFSQSKNGYTEKKRWNQCLASIDDKQWAWRAYSPDGLIVAAVALTVNYSDMFLPSLAIRNLNKKEIDMAMEHGLDNITWEKAWKQQ